MLEYQLKFARYDRQRCESRLSDATFIKADDFRGAQRIAEAVLTGLKTDLDRDYRILSIEERGARGIDCSGGGVSMFETQAEFSIRVMVAMSDADLSAELDRLQKLPVKPGSLDDDARAERIDRIRQEFRARSLGDAEALADAIAEGAAPCDGGPSPGAVR